MAQRLEIHQPEQTNTSLQRRMAEGLLSIGLDDAIELAALNDWQGGLSELYGLKSHPKSRILRST